MPVRIPVIEMIEIGAGGGSIASVDRLGRLTVGPQSAGSEPGPVAFGRGGENPTVTDSDVALGYIQADMFAEGHIDIDTKAALAALERDVGDKLSLDGIGAADGVSRIVDESMASAGRMHAVESGRDLGDRIMIAFGGNGPLHATRVARSAGVSQILIPPDPGVGSAVGFLFAPISFEIVRSRYSILDALDFAQINALFDAMIGDARAVVAQGSNGAPDHAHRTAFMRYSGQGHEIEIALPDRDLVKDDLGSLIAAFEDEYQTQFSRPVPGMKIEILNWAVRVSTKPTSAPPKIEISKRRTLTPDKACNIVCDLEGKPRIAGLFSRDLLLAGDTISGPALICEAQTTTLVSADFTACVDGQMNLVLTQNQSGDQV